jgi:hypothetical protein
MGNWFVDKCRMPRDLALRLEKLMNDAGDLTPEDLFRQLASTAVAMSGGWVFEWHHALGPGVA